MSLGAGPRLQRFGPAAGATVLGLLEVFLNSSRGVEVGVSQFAQVCFLFPSSLFDFPFFHYFFNLTTNTS